MPLASIAGGGMSPADFKQKVTINVDHVIGRINGIAPQYFSEEVSPLTSIPLNSQTPIFKTQKHASLCFLSFHSKFMGLACIYSSCI